MAKHAVYVYQCPQTFSFLSAPGVFDNCYLKTLRAGIGGRHLDWDVSADDTEGNFSEIEKRKYDLIICSPQWGAWLRFTGADRKKVIVLTAGEYFLCLTKKHREASRRRVLDFMAAD